MTCTVLDAVLIVIVVTAVIVETMRGFGCAAFDLVAVYGALLASEQINSNILRGLSPTTLNGVAVVGTDIGTFVFLAVAFIIVSRFASSTVRWHLGMLDRLVAFVAALAVGIVLSHGVVAGFAAGGPDQIAATGGAFSQQTLTFSSFHDLVTSLTSMTGPDQTNS